MTDSIWLTMDNIWLLPGSAFHPTGEILFKGKELLKASDREIRAVVRMR